MKFIIKYNTGYGDSYEEVEAENIEDAERMAYEAWREEVEGQANYSAMKWTQELADDFL